jgi:peptidoglycan hydrolase-like protein with peptidoglycan-binding domain
MTSTLGIAIAASFFLASTALAQTPAAPSNPCPPGQSQEKTNQPCAPTRITPSQPTPTPSVKRTDRHRHAAHGGRTMGKQEVKSAQEALKAKGYDAGASDGAMGPRTRAAVRNFQKAEGLRATGRLDADTRTKLGV